jgi:hypothetical protein
MDSLILTLDASGFPFGWMTWQEAVTHEVSGRVFSHVGGFEFTFRGGESRLTGRESRVTVSSIMVLRGSSPMAWRHTTVALTNPALFHRDRYVCAYCGKHGERSVHLTRDHIVPTSRGGADTWSNVVTACARCNTHKADRCLDEVGMQLLYVPYAPTLHEGLLLSNRRILADQMELLQAMLPKYSRLKLLQ